MTAKVTIDQEICKGCGLCVPACPRHIVALEADRVNSVGYHTAAVTDLAQCIACGSCARMCHDSAITVERD